MRIAFQVLAIALTVSGCATGSYTPPTARDATAENERLVQRSFDSTWASLVNYSASTFFSIDRFEKASGLMTLTFGTSDPARYIDCGHMVASGGTVQLDMPYAAYLNQRFGGKLDGKMNIVVQAVTPDTTLVRVNARYIFVVPATSGVPPQIWSFDSGGAATVAVQAATPGTIPTRTCRPTYAAERAILDAVGK